MNPALGAEEEKLATSSEKTFSVVSQAGETDNSAMATATITPCQSTDGDAVPEPPFDQVAPQQAMDKPASLAHYVSRSGVPALAQERYIAARKQAALEMQTTFGYAHRGRKNVHWHPQTGVFVYSIG